MSSIILVDGEPQEGSRLEIDCLSPGFAYGYGLFETAKFIKGSPIFFREHFERLSRSAGEAEIAFQLSEEECLKQLRELFRLNDAEEGIYKIYVFEDSGRYRIIMAIRSELPLVSAEPLRLRESLVVKAAHAFTSSRKTMNYFENWRELKAAHRLGYDDCFFVNDSGFLTECSVRNLFFVVNGTLRTPSLDCGLLNGVIRQVVLQIASEDGISVEEGAFRLSGLEVAEGIFTTSSASGIVPVIEIQTDSFHWQREGEHGMIENLRTRLMQRELDDVEALR